MKSGKTPDHGTSKKRIVLDLFRHAELRRLLDTLHRKTGMRSNIDIIRMALKNLNANLPEALTDNGDVQ